MDIKLTFQQLHAISKETKELILPLGNCKEGFEKLDAVINDLPKNPNPEQCAELSHRFREAWRTALELNAAFGSLWNKVALLEADTQSRN